MRPDALRYRYRRIDSRFAFSLIVTVLLPLLISCLHAAEKKTDLFVGLRQTLVRDGFDKKQLDRHYRQPGVEFETKAISSFFHHREAALNYDQFLTPDSLYKAGEYMRQHHNWLEKAETEFQVEKEIITAILLVETRLGTIVGKTSTLNILSSMAALSDPAVQEMLWQSISGTTNMTRDEYNKKATQKSKWAYAELKAFLTYVDKENIANPVDVLGSYAGALGISQFMPSNILKLAVDGDQDGRTNLFVHADAIFSVANYLRHHGWEPGLNEQQARKVLFAYNHSTYYVDTLRKISSALKERP